MLQRNMKHSPPYPSDLAAIRGLMALVTAHSEYPEQSVEEGRARNDLHGLSVPMPDGCDKCTISIGGVPGEKLTPRGADPSRVLLCLHGGGYQQGSAKSHRHFAARLAEAAGAVAVVPDYRLAPEHPCPAAIDDVLSVYRALLEESAAKTRIALAGDSAGGGLALAAGVAIRDAGLPSPAALYVVSPWVDLTPPAPSYISRAPLDPVVTLESLERMGARYAGPLDRADSRVSPLFADLRGLPPLFIHVGTDEILYEDGLRLAHAARQAGVHVRLEVGERMIHVWPLFHEVLRAGRAAIAEAGEWLSDRFEDDVSSPAHQSAGRTPVD